MQTRKRNIDSVLNLVNPKRLKVQKADSIKGNNTDEGKKYAHKSSKKKQVAISENIDKKVCKSKRTKNKEELLKNNRDDKIVDKTGGTQNADKLFEKSKCTTNKEKPLKNDGDDKIDCKTGRSQNADKPFKKRPVPDIKVSGTTPASKEVKLFHRGNIKTLNEETTCENKVQAERKKKEGTADSVEEFTDKNLDQQQCNDAISDTEKQDIKVLEKADFEEGKQIDGNSQPKPVMIQVEVKKEPEVKIQQQSLEDTTESDLDDDFIDSGAIDDDRDEDYRVPKGESDEDNVNSRVKNETKATQVNDSDRRDREKDQYEKNAVETNHQFVCKTCNKMFPTRDRLKKHTVMHTGEKPYECEICQMKFGLQTYLNRHMEVHLDSSEKSFSCDQCPKTFARQSSLDKHKVSHQDARPFSCSVCFKKFKRKLTLTNHLKAHQNGDIYMCQYCGKSFAFRSSLDAHTKKHSEKKPFNCTECGKGFYSKQSFNDHQLRHQKIKEVECPICKRKYYNKKELRKHMTFHSKVTEFYCELCLMYFNDPHCLRIHTSKIHGQRYSCEFCDAKFSNFRAMNKHVFKEHRELRNARRPKMPMHEKANFRHVLCDFCGKELSNKYRLKKHLIAKHSGKKIKIVRDPTAIKVPTKLYPSEMKVLCMICNKVMFNKYKLLKHMEKVHDIPLEEIKNIKIVKIEGISEKETVKKGKQEQEVDVQTIVIKPVSLNSYESKSVAADKRKYGKSTVHYLDAHGNIIYTDTERVDKNHYKLGHKLEANHMRTSNRTDIKDIGLNTNISLLSDPSVNKNVAQVKCGESVSFPNNIVDFAAQAANIIDRNKNPLTNESVKVDYSQLSDQEKYDYPHDTNNVQDITYIMQQAAGRIVAHEKAESLEVVNNHTYNSSQHDLKFLVNDAENTERVTSFDLNEEGVRYIIEETVRDVIGASNPGFVVDEGNTEITNGQILTESSDSQQEQKIIIIDEEGVEQIITTGPSEQIKIIYDPETGLYTYIAEELDVKQEETNTSMQKADDNWVILNEDLSIQNTTPTQDIESKNIETALEYSVDSKVMTESKVVDLQNVQISEQDNAADNSKENTSRQIQVVPDTVNTPGSDASKILTFHNDSNTISQAKSGLEEIQHVNTQVNGTFAAAKHLSEVGRDLSSATTPLTHIPPLTYTTLINASEIIRPEANSTMASQVQTSQISVNDSSTMKTMHSIGLPTETNTLCIPSLNQHSQMFTGVVESSPSSFPSLSSSAAYSNSLLGHSSGTSGYLDHNSQPQSQLTQNHQESVCTEQAPVNDSSSQMLDDISQAVLTLEHSSADVESPEFPNIAYNKNTIDNREIVTNSQMHCESMTPAEGLETHTIGDGNNVDKTEISADDMCEKKDFVHLENILKTGIKDVSNTEEYTNFLDRMINHLQSAKETVIGQHIQQNDLHGN